MRNITLSIAILVALLLVSVVADPLLAEPPDRAQTSRVGTISATWNESGELAELVLCCAENDRELTYPLKLDAHSKALAALEGQRVALTFASAPSEKGTSVKSFLSTRTGHLQIVEPDEGEEEGPIAYLLVEEDEEDEPGEYAVVTNAHARQLIQKANGRRVEVLGNISTRDGMSWIEVSAFNLVLRGHIEKMTTEEEESDEPAEEDEEERAEETPLVFVCDDTNDVFVIHMNALGKRVASELTGVPLEIVGSASIADDEPQVTILRYMRLYQGRIEVATDEDGEPTVRLRQSAGVEPSELIVMPIGKGEELAELNGRRVTITGTVKERDGTRWITVRTLRRS